MAKPPWFQCFSFIFLCCWVNKWALLGGDAGGERASSIPSAGMKVKEGVVPLFREGRCTIRENNTT